MVYVLNKYGNPLMPCSEKKARRLLKQGKATVCRKDIFTIQLKYGSYGYKQDVTLGIDCGSKHIGISATTDKRELFSGTAELRTDISKLLADRRMMRSNRRSRKTRYRKQRFSNRRKPDGWLAPSIQQKLESHVRIVKLIHYLLPVSKVNVEVAAFDIQKIKDPNIEGEGYQQGEQLGFFNVREYVLYRDGHVCQHCKGKSGDKILNVHHIESRKVGGNAPNNLITLCETCHGDYHAGKIELNVKRGRTFRDESAMCIMRWNLYDKLKGEFNNVHLTYGYITKSKRINLGIPKEHYMDAYCIADNLNAERMSNHTMIRFVPRHSRILHVQKFSKGGKRRSESAPYWLNGGKPSKSGTMFTRFDKVKYNGKVCFISGSSHGHAYVKNINWNKIDGCKSTITVNKLILIFHRHSNMIME